VTGETLPAVESQRAAGEIEVQIVRTVPEKVYRRLPRGDFRILEAYQRAFRSAEHFIYLENQFLWSPEIASVLVEKLSRPPSADFRIVMLLPAKPATGTDDTRGVLGELVEADADAGRILACTIYARSGARADPIYVHAKVGIVDDAWITIGSANLNEHSLFNDTEMNLVSHDAALALETRLRLWAEHLELAVDELRRDPSRGDRPTVGPNRQGSARATGSRPAAHPPARPTAARFEALGPRLRPAVGLARRRLVNRQATLAVLVRATLRASSRRVRCRSLGLSRWSLRQSM